jgi:hypothetical protein
MSMFNWDIVYKKWNVVPQIMCLYRLPYIDQAL